jgi:SHS2 domain-containing protein
MQPGVSSHGFQELPHTADWAMKVWAEDLPGLFVEAANGMNTLSGAQLSAGPRIKRSFAHHAEDAETLLVAFLSELVYLQEQERLGFTHFDVTLDGLRLSVEMEGAALAALEKPIKAVTFHNLEILKTPGRYEVQVVFDV